MWAGRFPEDTTRWRTHAKPQPVRIRHLFVVHPSQPPLKVLFGICQEGVPELLFGHSDGESNGGAFDHTLILVPHISPEFFVVRICSTCKAADPALRAAVLTATREEGSEAPDGTGEPFKLRSSFIEVSACVAKVYARASGGGMRGERVEETDEEVTKVVFGFQWVMREGRFGKAC
jgi:hypothetical protein